MNAFANSKPADELRDGADVAALFVVSNPDYCGIAYLDTIMSKYTFSITAKDCGVGYYVFGHEIGHNVGCHHDPATDTNTIYPYAHGHLIAGGNGHGGMQSIMSYWASGHDTRANYWSSPNVIHPLTGTPTGVADLSDNVRLWQEKRASLAAVGDESTSKKTFV